MHAKNAATTIINEESKTNYKLAPDGSIPGDLGHHLVASLDGAIIAHFPARVRVELVALVARLARAALVERVAFWERGKMEN